MKPVENMTVVESNTDSGLLEKRIRELEANLEKKNFAFESLFRMFEKLGTTLELDKIIRLFLMTLAGQLFLDSIGFYLFSNKTGKLELYHSLGSRKQEVPESIIVESDLIGWILKQEFMADLKKYKAQKEEEPGAADDSVFLFLEAGFSDAYPLIDDTDLVGMIFFGERIDNRDFTDFNMEILHMIVKVATMAIRNASLYQATVQSKILMENFSRVKREFMHHTSHELRTPLTVLKSSLWSIEATDENDAQLVDMAKNSVGVLQERVEQVLALNDVWLNEAYLDLRDTDIASLLENCFREMIPELGEREITISLDKQTDKHYILIDPSKMQIVFNSLIDNAVSSIEKNGTIMLSLSYSHVGPDDSEGIRISSWEASDIPIDMLEVLEGELRGQGNTGLPPDTVEEVEMEGFLVVKVIDDGVGIPFDEIKRISEPFRRASNSKLSEVRGLGIGLSISEKIISAHNGHLYCKSAEGKGSEFSIWLPWRKHIAGL